MWIFVRSNKYFLYIKAADNNHIITTTVKTEASSAYHSEPPTKKSVKNPSAELIQNNRLNVFNLGKH